MTGLHYIAMALSFALVITRTAGAGTPAPPADHETDRGRRPLATAATSGSTDVPDENPSESHDCSSCHAIDLGSDTNQFALESDDPACPHLDMHHTLYGSVIPYPTAAPYSEPGELYACLSCHEVDTSSGTNQILVERDCQVCHDADSHHMLYGSAIAYPTDVPYSTAVEQYVCLSCHEIVTSSGGNEFLVERDCLACHHTSRVENVIVDIKPGLEPNWINTEARSDLRVAILSSGDYDVTAIDASSLLLEGEVAPSRSSLGEGVDGYMDLTLSFPGEAVANALGDLQTSQPYEVRITGAFEDGTRLVGSDSVVALPRSWRNRPERPRKPMKRSGVRQ
jgi:hypothetical protein